MTKALLLAVELRSRQYAELLASCVSRPGAAAQELVARPERWWPAAALLWLAVLCADPHFVAGNLILLAFFAAFCRLRTGAFRPLLWLECWGCALFPLLASRAVLYPFVAYELHRVRFQPRAAGALFFVGLALVNAAVIFAALRLILHCVRAVAKSTWTVAWGLSMASMACGYAMMLAIWPNLRP